MSTASNAPPALLARREGGVLVLTNNNETARNALSPEFYLGLTDALNAAATDASVGAIVLTGAGGHFCSGGNLRRIAERRKQAPEVRRESLEGLHNLVRAVRNCPKPVIAAVEGAAAGAGLSLAMSCDMLVAAKNAVFSVAYVKVGLSPDGGATAFLAEHLSRQVLTELCLTGDRISGERMHELGMVNRLTDAGAALAEAVALAAKLADGPLAAMGSIKSLCRAAYDNSLEEQLDMEAVLMVQAQGTNEAEEGIGAFLEKRSPDYVKLRK